ncbi:hypothetical protein [Agromyces tropicus]
MRPNAAVGAATATLLALLLAGCTPPAPDPGPSPTAAPSPPAAEPTPAAPLDCDGIVPTGLVADALQGGAPEPVEPVVATQPLSFELFPAMLLEGLGGLDCSWRVGSGMPEYNDPSDWAYLRLAVLPDAASEWVPLATYEGMPSTLTRRIGGIDASFEGGDLGLTYSAPVGDDWVLLSLRAAGLTAEGGRFRGVDGGDELDRLDAVAEAAYSTVAAAAPDEPGPPRVELRRLDRPAVCRGGLAAPGLLMASGASDAEVVVSEPTGPPDSFAAAIAQRARLFTCSVSDGVTDLETVRTARGFGGVIDDFTRPDLEVGFSPIAFADVPDGAGPVVGYVENDVSPRYGGDAVLAIGDSLYWIRGLHPEAIARAIVAQTY